MSHSQGFLVKAISVPSTLPPQLPAHPQTSQGKKEKNSGCKAKTSLKEPALLLPCGSCWNTNQGRRVPESLPQAHGPRLGKEEGKIRILSKASRAPGQMTAAQTDPVTADPPPSTGGDTGEGTGIHTSCWCPREWSTLLMVRIGH